MPTCLNCESYFPNIKFIDGKSRILNKRKYCLDCSPFNQHNTNQIHIKNNLICDVCEKPYEYKRGYGSHSKCGSCLVNAKRFSFKKKCLDYKGGECKICGYNKCVKALDFHHLDPQIKEFSISGGHCRNWDSVKLELDKCICVCNRCHTEIHDGMHGNVM